MRFWNNYWFGPSPVLDLAVVRIICCVVTLLTCFVFHNYFADLAGRLALDDTLYRPTFLFKLIHLPFGWGYSGEGGADGLGVWAFRPPALVLQAALNLFLLSGFLAAIGLRTNLSLTVFASSFFYVQSYMYSFGDFHHSQAAMLIAVAAFALSPAGRVLSVDHLLRIRAGTASWDDLYSDLPGAGWALKLMQWFFALMYISAAWAKISIGGIEWVNGYTLQYYLMRDGLRWGSELAVWLSQFHILILLGQLGVMVFQITFFLDILFPRLRWIYVPIGLCLHVMIYVTLRAPFFTWMALYSVFIPWRDALLLLHSHQARSRQGI